MEICRQEAGHRFLVPNNFLRNTDTFYRMMM